MSMNARKKFPLIPEEGDTPLHTAIKDEQFDVSVIRSLLREGADPNARNSRGCVPLHYAMAHPNADLRVMRMLVKDYGAGVEIRQEGNTPLHWLLRAYDIKNDVIIELLRCGADVNARDKITLSALSLAVALRCDIDIINEIIKRGADVNEQIYYPDQNTPLHYASAFLKLEVVHELLQKGAQVEVKNANGETPLLHAFAGPFMPDEEVIDVTKKLVEHGADVNTHDGANVTPLLKLLRHFSNDFCKFELGMKILKTLLNVGADVNAEDRDGWNPLSICLETPHLEPLVIQELLEHGADTNKTYQNGLTLLHHAVQRYESLKHPTAKECVELLIKYTLLNSEEWLRRISRKGVREFIPLDEFQEYTSACFSQLVKAKAVKIFDNVSLYTVLTGRSFTNNAACLIDSDVNDAVEKLLLVLLRKEFSIFSDLIESLLRSERKLMCHKLGKLICYTRSPTFGHAAVDARDITLNYDCALQITSYLSDCDVLHLILAYFDSYGSAL